MKLLVTGGTGFLGRYAVERLLDRGHELLLTVTAPDHVPAGWATGTVTFVDAYGGLDDSAVRSFGPDALLHLAWAGIPTLDAAWSLKNVAISSRVFATALEAGVQRIVGVGSCREYQAGGGTKAESDIPADHTDVFGQAKTSVAQLLRAACEDQGVEWRWARPFFVYGPGQRSESLIPAAIAKAAAGSELAVSSPDAAVDFIHVNDVAEALCVLSTEPGPSGAFNIGSGGAHNVASVASWVRRDWLGESGSKILRANNEQQAWWADIASISENYGWTPKTPLEIGIHQMVVEARS